jgi:hypothetical protein
MMAARSSPVRPEAAGSSRMALLGSDVTLITDNHNILGTIEITAHP